MAIENVSFTLEIDSGYAALVDDPTAEIARLLRAVADKVAGGHESGKVSDDNGNTVGTFELEIEEEDDPELPDEAQAIIDQIEAGDDDDLEVLGVGQTGDRVFDDGEWRVWRERVGPEDGYDGPPATIEHYDGHRWTDFDPNA